MEDRTVVEWDKDDLDALGIFKVDVLALGMLTCLRKSFDLIEKHYGEKPTLDMRPTDPAVYDMLCKADSVGVFQVESRAQMSMLPRLKAAELLRPRRRGGDRAARPHPGRHGPSLSEEPAKKPEDIYYPGELENILEEDARRAAVPGAGDADRHRRPRASRPAKADKLRRAMATFRRAGTIHKLKDDFIKGMVGNGYERDFAERCFKQIEGFGEYGFPESHAASFAILVYVSSWVKHYYPEVFAAALLNSQPMGFYAPAQLVRDAREHDVEVRPPDVNASDWDCTLEPGRNNRCALRLGLRQVTGLAEDDVKRMVERRTEPYRDPADLWRRCGLTKRQIMALARADAFASLGLSRRDVLWAVRGFSDAQSAAARWSDRSARPRARRHPARAHPGRAGGRRLRRHLDVAALPSAGAAAAAAFRSRRGADCRAGACQERRSLHPGRPGAGAPAAGHRLGRGLRHHRGRMRHRQPRGLAQGLRGAPPHRHGLAPAGRARPRAARRAGDPSRRRAALGLVGRARFHRRHRRVPPGPRPRRRGPHRSGRPPRAPRGPAVPEANATRHRSRKGPPAKPAYDRSRIVLDRPKIKIASRDFH